MGEAKRRKDLGLYPAQTKKPEKKPRQKSVDPFHAMLRMMGMYGGFRRK